MYDVIVIGKGPAGISCAIYTTRANLKTLVIGKSDSMLLKADKIENYYGFENPIGGKELLDTGLKQALRLGAQIVDDEVVSIEKTEKFRVISVNGEYEATTVLLATGAPVVRVPVKNIDKFEGSGVSYCTTCDGFFYRNKKVGVLGYTDFAIHEANELAAFTQDITIYTNNMPLNISENLNESLSKFKVNTAKIAEIQGQEKIEEIVFADGSKELVQGLFVAYGSASSTSFALKMGIATEGKSITVNDKMETNIPGLFAAGDCTGVFKQISVAVGQGAIASRQMIDYVRKTGKDG
ncbi:MAG: NAD(P)/FAD-dependent oxidoreductase [Acetivibrionales bacterium]|nr:NAD(P)/FAD-dependent oxidoreductase [Clostridiaceae bacterium]